MTIKDCRIKELEELLAEKSGFENVLQERAAAAEALLSDRDAALTELSQLASQLEADNKILRTRCAEFQQYLKCHLCLLTFSMLF